MRTFHCKWCNVTVQAKATDVSHRCPAKKRQFVQFEEVKEKDDR